ncbi:hypothetical protein TNCV_2550831 [Trichonephila clavipes]|nr:hypothetical protein TNCV_2550831 [Trichonephila clavipes]
MNFMGLDVLDEINVRLSLALALNIIQVTIHFDSVPLQLEGKHLGYGQGSSHISSPSPTSRENSRFDGNLEYSHAARTTSIPFLGFELGPLRHSS